MDRKNAPSDAEAEKAYTQAMALAEGAGLIVQAGGGVATIAIPSEQRKAGIRERILATHGLREIKDGSFPGTGDHARPAGWVSRSFSLPTRRKPNNTPLKESEGS